MYVRTDIDKMERFLDHLQRFDDLLEDEFKAMRSHWHDLGGVWDDDQYRKLGADLEEADTGVQRYLEAAETREAYLKDLINILKDYHNR